MPRENTLSRETAITIVKHFFHKFENDNFPENSDPVWKEMSIKSEGKWSPYYWQVSVKNDRRGIFTEVKNANSYLPSRLSSQKSDTNLSQHHYQVDTASSPERETNLPIPTNKKCSSLKNNFQKVFNTYGGDDLSSSSDESTQLDPPDEFNSEFEDGQNEFELEICAEDWEKIKPIYSQHKRTTHTLNPREWSNLICDKFHQKFREHKCAYVFKRSEVYVSERRKYFLKITGKCCSDKCGNDFVGVANDDPSTTNGKLLLKIKTRDTSQVWQHESVVRPLNGSKREILGKSAVAEGSNELHRRLCKDLLMPGELKAPKIPQINAIRRAKQEASDNRFGIERKKGEDAFDRLRRAKYTPSYHGLIQEIGADPLLVFYGTREQIFFYKKMHKKMGGKVSLSIDASGRFILKLLRAIGPPAAHTFLYLIVAHFGTTSVSIYQMLSESQVTERITYFLRVFLRLANYKKPLWITMDFSRALLSATCLACNDINIKHYNSICFNAAKSGIEVPRKWIKTFLRVDVSHMIHLACRWKLWKTEHVRDVKEFYIQCIGLMIDCQRFRDFIKIFRWVLIVASHEYNYSHLVFSSNNSCENAKEAKDKLTNIIINRPLDKYNYFKLPEESQDVNNDDDKFDNHVHDSSYDTDNTDDLPFEIIAFFDNLLQEAQLTTLKTPTNKDPNHYRRLPLIPHLIRIGREFSLWTAVCMPHYTGHASSSYCERLFGDLKNNVFKNFPLPQSLDNFVLHHLSSLIGGIRSISSDLEQFYKHGGVIPDLRLKSPENKVNNQVVDEKNIEKITEHENFDDSGTQGQENWYGLARFPRFNHSNLSNESSDDSKSDTSLRTPSHYSIENTSKPKQTDIIYENSDQSFLDKISNNEKNNFISSSSDESNPTIDDNKKEPIYTENKPSNSKYFRSNPELAYREFNNNPISHQIVNGKKKKASKKKKKDVILKNASLCGIVTINSQKFLGIKTCAFDALAHVIFTVAIDDPNYYSTIKEATDNQFCQFIINLTESGQTAKINKDRFLMLQAHHKDQSRQSVHSVNKLNESVTTYDFESCPVVNWCQLLGHTNNHVLPSAHYMMKCSSCGNEYCDVIETLMISLKPIRESKNYKCLQSALKWNIPEAMNCKNENCANIVKVDISPALHVFIELGVREGIEQDSAMISCRLKDIPNVLDIGNTKYRLAGVLHYAHEHFTAYCRRIKGQWNLYDDMKPKKQFIQRANPKITPVGAIYILINP